MNPLLGTEEILLQAKTAMERVGCSVTFCILLILTLVHSDPDYDRFVVRWQLNKDLKCIHRHVKDLGPDPKALRGEPSFEGFRTTCFFLQEGTHLVHVNKWPSYEDLLAVYFIPGKPPFTPVVKEGDRIQDCRSLSDMESSSQPQWITSNDLKEVERKLRTHCFYKKIDGKAKYKYVFKVTYYPQRGKSSGYFESKRILFLIPKNNNYFIARSEEDMDKVCTRCTAGGGFSQTPVVKGSNITALLKEASEKYYG